MNERGILFEGKYKMEEGIQKDFFNKLWKKHSTIELPSWIYKDPWVLRRLSLMGKLKDKQMLELGCGSEIWPLFFALKGVYVHAIDISLEGVKLTAKAAKKYQLNNRLLSLAGSAYYLPYKDNFFDIVQGQNILHHLDIYKAGKEIRRVLKYNGISVFLENSANNKILMFARKLCGHFGIPKWSMDNEYPLSRKQIKILEGELGKCEIHYPAFQFFRLLDEKIFKNRIVTRKLDKVIYKYFPFLRKYSYIQLLKFTKK